MTSSAGPRSEGVAACELVALGLVLGLAFALGVWNNDFPLGYHADEPKKVRFVREGTQDFRHPLLLLQATRLASRLLAVTEPEQVAVLGRSISAAFACAMGGFAWVLFRRRFSAPRAILATSACLFTPLVAVHAHYLKEDVALTCFLVASLLFAVRVFERGRVGNVAGLGLFLGLAASTKYVAIVLFPVLVLGGVVCVLPGERPRVFRQLVGAGVVAVLVFALVNFPILAGELPVLFAGLAHESRHALRGHDVRVGPLETWFLFHARQSLVPGVGLPLLGLAVAGLVATLSAWRRAPAEDRLLVAYVVAFYLVPEASPLKPFPDFGRYMLPLAPALAFFAVRSIELAGRHPGRERIAVAMVVLAVGFAAQRAVRFVLPMNEDTRAVAAAWIARSGKVMGYGPRAWVEAEARMDAAGSAAPSRPCAGCESQPEAIALNSFEYERYFVGSRLPGQSAAVYEMAARLRRLWQLPYLEFRPAFETYAFGNPTVRIVDLSGRAVGSGSALDGRVGER